VQRANKAFCTDSATIFLLMWSVTEVSLTHTALLLNVERLSLAIHHDFFFFPSLTKANEINTLQHFAIVSQKHVHKDCYSAFIGCWLKKTSHNVGHFQQTSPISWCEQSLKRATWLIGLLVSTGVSC